MPVKELIFEELENSSLSTSSLNTLKSKLNRLFETKPFPENILEEVIPKINVNNNDKTELAYVSNIRTIAKNSPTFRDLIKNQLSVIQEFNKGINETINRYIFSGWYSFGVPIRKSNSILLE